MTQSTDGQTPSVALRQRSEALPKLSIDPNSRIYVRLNPLSQQSQPMQGEFIGLSHYEYLILRVPSVPGLLNKLIPHTMMEIRFLFDGAVNSFTAELLSHAVKPALMLFATYPDRLNMQETRKHRRITCALPAILNTLYGDAKGILSDLSMGGCKVTLDLSGQSALRDMAVGDEIVLQTVFDSNGIPAGGTAIVRNIEVTGSKLRAGLSFNDTHKDFSTALSSYLELSRLLV